VAIAAPRSPTEALTAFTRWLVENPVAGDRIYGHTGVRYQVARYCEYLLTNPSPAGDVLRDPVARAAVRSAYREYLAMFDTPAGTIALILVSLDHFYAFVDRAAPRRAAR
jgi:hypothetical protein